MAATEGGLSTSPHAAFAMAAPAAKQHSSLPSVAPIRSKTSTQPLLPTTPCVDIICCDADCPASAPTSPCSDVHHISSTCTEPSCGAASSSTAAIVCSSAVACCDDTACIDVAGSPCSQSSCSASADCSSMTLAVPTIATCCDDEACDEPELSPRVKARVIDVNTQESHSHKDRHHHIASNECRECRGSTTNTNIADGGKLYSSFQELLDCCCCSMPPTVEQCCVGQSPYPCNAPHPSSTENTGHAAHGHHHHQSSHDSTAASLSDTLSSSVITNGTQQTSPDLHHSGSRASTASTAATPQPVTASPLQWSTPFINASTPQDKGRLASTDFSGQPTISLEDIFTELQSWNDCSFEQPHLHSSHGGCLPPAMTLCESDICPTSAPHSHWTPNAHQQADFTAMSASASTQPQDTRPQQCQWGGCNERFWTVEELVAHVNHSHLARKSGDALQNAHGHSAMPPAQAEASGLVPTAVQSSAAALECLWNDCYQVTVPDKLEYGTFTPTSEMDAWKAGNAAASDKLSLAILQHLLHDHLGQHSAQPISLKREHLPPTSAAAHQQDASAPALSSAESSSTDSGFWNKKRKHSEASSAPCSSSGGGGEDSDELFCRWEGCSALFTSHSALTDHIETAHVGSGKASYECRWLGCARHASGQRFSQKQKVLRHIQTHTGDRPFKCDLCGKRFSEQNTLAQHMRTHTQERPYGCDFPGCGKAFSVAGSLTIHKRTHTGSKPFVCSYPGCSKAFAESSNLTKHMRTHTGDKPFICEECGKGFSRPDQASRHRKTHERKRVKSEMMSGQEGVVAT